MDLARLRWLTRYTIALLELGSILAICSFIFFSNVDLDDKWTNIIATVVGVFSYRLVQCRNIYFLENLNTTKKS